MYDQLELFYQMPSCGQDNQRGKNILSGLCSRYRNPLIHYDPLENSHFLTHALIHSIPGVEICIQVLASALRFTGAPGSTPYNHHISGLLFT